MLFFLLFVVDTLYFMFNIVCIFFFFFFKQKTAYEMRISDWSSDVCSSDLEQTGEYASVAGCGKGAVKACAAQRMPDAQHQHRQPLHGDRHYQPVTRSRNVS